MPTNALDHITIRGFKSIASIEKLELRPINVVIGANGSGKSNFIGAFEFIQEVLEHNLRQLCGRGGRRGKNPSLRLEDHKGNRLRPLFRGRRTISSSSNQPQLTNYSCARGNFKAGRAPLTSLHWRIYHFDDTSSSSPMRKTAKVDDNRFLRADGSNLPAYLYLLREKYHASYELIVRTVQQVAPFFDDFRLEPLELNPDSIKLEWRHKRSDQYFDASSLSDGTLRFIALATLFLQPEQYRPSVILVDEPELGLHPYALGVFAALVSAGVCVHPSDRLYPVIVVVGSF